MNITLYPHQIKNIDRMLNYETNNGTPEYTTNVGWLADAAGYGKSFCIIGLILKDLEQNDPDINEVVNLYNDLSLNLRHNRYSTCKGLRTTVIFCSNSIVKQWEKYFYDVVKKSILKVIVFRAAIPIDYTADVIIVGHTTWASFVFLTDNQTRWRRCVFDDIETTYESRFYTPKALYYWFVSATLGEFVKNRSKIKWFSARASNNVIRSLWNKILDTDLKIINSLEELQASVAKIPCIINRKIHEVTRSAVLQAVSEYVSRDVANALQIGDVSAALTILNVGDEKFANIINAVKHKLQTRLDNENRYLLASSNEQSIKQHTTTIKSIEGDMANLETKFREIMNSECLICTLEIKTHVVFKCCNMIICAICTCHIKNTNNTCPMCRAALTTENTIARLETASDEAQAQASIKPRVQSRPVAIKQLIEEKLADDTAKILIVSDIEGDMYNELKAKYDCKISKISGTTFQRANTIAKYKTGPINALYINAKFNAAGINLENTTDIIFCHDFHESIREQLIGRAIRCNRTLDYLTLHDFAEV